MVNFELTKEEVLSYGDIMTGLVANYNVIPTYKVLDDVYEDVLPSYAKQRALLTRGPLYQAFVRSVLRLSGN